MMERLTAADRLRAHLELHRLRQLVALPAAPVTVVIATAYTEPAHTHRAIAAALTDHPTGQVLVVGYGTRLVDAGPPCGRVVVVQLRPWAAGLRVARAVGAGLAPSPVVVHVDEHDESAPPPREGVGGRAAGVEAPTTRWNR